MKNHSNSKEPIDWYIVSQIRDLRHRNGLTQTDLAIALNVSVGFIGQVESVNHSAKYNIYHLCKLSQLFNCSMRNFFPADVIAE
jgi:transcriptional regulator with XRE-family HTH domain